MLAAEATRLSFPQHPFFALAAAPCLAFLPMFGYMNANLSNEPLGMVFGAALWLQLVRLARSLTPYTVASGALLGITLGLAALTRPTFLLWLPALALVLWHCARRAPASGRAAPLLAGAACFLLLLCPWLIHNQLTFGSALIRTAHRPLLGGDTLAQFVSGSFFAPYLMLTALWDSSTAWCPFWMVQFCLPGGAERGVPLAGAVPAPEPPAPAVPGPERLAGAAPRPGVTRPGRPPPALDGLLRRRLLRPGPISAVRFR